MSQPTRAVWWFCLLNDIKHEFKLVKILGMEHTKPEFAKINPHRKVPAIVDNGLAINESHTIMRYLKEKYNAADHWYPKKLEDRIKVDQYLDWHHLNMRAGAAGYFQCKYLLPTMGRTVSENRLKATEKQLASALKSLNDIFLGSSPYIAGNKISIADLSCYCELKQLEGLQYDMSAYTNVTQWKKKLEALPHYDTTHLVYNKFAARLKSQSNL